MEIKRMQAKYKVNALPAELSLKFYRVKFAIQFYVKFIQKNHLITSFNFFCKMYCLLWICFKFLGDVSGLAEFTISSQKKSS